MMASPDRGLRDNQLPNVCPKEDERSGKGSSTFNHHDGMLKPGPDETQTADFILGLSLEHDGQVTSSPRYGTQTSPPTVLPGSVAL